MSLASIKPAALILVHRGQSSVLTSMRGNIPPQPSLILLGPPQGARLMAVMTEGGVETGEKWNKTTGVVCKFLFFSRLCSSLREF